MKNIYKILALSVLLAACVQEGVESGPTSTASIVQGLTVWETETPCEALAEVQSYSGPSADLVTGSVQTLMVARLLLIPTDLTGKDATVLIPINSPEEETFHKFYAFSEDSCVATPGTVHLFNRGTGALEGRSLKTDGARHYGSTHVIRLKDLRHIDRIPLAVPPPGYTIGLWVGGYGGIGDF